jgi:hypothetical protein
MLHPATYIGIALVALAAAVAVRFVVGRKLPGAPWPAVVSGSLLVAIGASVFLPLKCAIPREVPFWLDEPIATLERSMFGADPWILLDEVLGWAAVPMDWLYACWLPVQSLVLFSLVLATPSRAKSRALIAYSLAWFLLGVVAAALLSSAGPLFYDRLYGGTAFAGLEPTLRARGTWIALAESDQMWRAMTAREPGLVAGISAMPSIHVAVSFWMFLMARTIMPRAAPAALIYCGLIWIGSVQLGWHYVADGLFGIIGMIAVWYLAALVQNVLLKARRGTPSAPSDL